MKAILLCIAAFTLSVVLYGCESDSGDDDSKHGTYPSEYVAAYFNEPFYGADAEGSILIIQTESGELIAVTPDTRVRKMAASCHGYDYALISDLHTGDGFDAILAAYVPDQDRQSIAATEISIHNPDCEHVEYVPVVVPGTPTP